MSSPDDGPVVFLLGPRTSHSDFERFARKCGWVLHEARASEGPKRPYEQIWLTADRSTAIHYMDDSTPKERFLVVYGSMTGDVAFDVGANLDAQTSDDVLDRALRASSIAEKVDAAWQIGVVTKVYNEMAFDILKALYDGGDELIRHAVVNAIGYRGWPEARRFLEEVAQNDPSEKLRDNVRDIVDAWWGSRSGSGGDPPNP